MSVPRRKWSPADNLELRRAYAIADHLQASAAVRKLAKRLGIEIGACHGHARVLGIVRVCRANRTWTQAEIENLKMYAGKVPTSRIARILGRTKTAVDLQLSRMQTSAAVKERGYGRGQLYDLMGLDHRTARKLFDRHPIITGLFGNVFPQELRLWLWDHLDHVDLRKMDQAWLKQVLRGRE